VIVKEDWLRAFPLHPSGKTTSRDIIEAFADAMRVLERVQLAFRYVASRFDKLPGLPGRRDANWLQGITGYLIRERIICRRCSNRQDRPWRSGLTVLVPRKNAIYPRISCRKRPIWEPTTRQPRSFLTIF
jgi:hypothetical protein